MNFKILIIAFLVIQLPISKISGQDIYSIAIRLAKEKRQLLKEKEEFLREKAMFLKNQEKWQKERENWAKKEQEFSDRIEDLEKRVLVAEKEVALRELIKKISVTRKIGQSYIMPCYEGKEKNELFNIHQFNFDTSHVKYLKSYFEIVDSTGRKSEIVFYFDNIIEWSGKKGFFKKKEISGKMILGKDLAYKNNQLRDKVTFKSTSNFRALTNGSFEIATKILKSTTPSKSLYLNEPGRTYIFQLYMTVDNVVEKTFVFEKKGEDEWSTLLSN